MNSFRDLRNRRVYRAAAGYAMAAWLTLQFSVTVRQILGLPEWTLKAVVALLFAGFTAAVAVGWALDRREVAGSSAEGRGRRRHLALAAVAFVPAAVVAAVFLWFNHSSQPKSDRSIAVLPFKNLSSDPDNAYFADGIQDEILTRLARIGALKVISRTSTARYASSPGNVPEIAQQLGVAHILEGSVQKVGDNVRVNVQLIRADTDSHLWADFYDRRLTDIFGVESEIAKAIADQLQAQLTGAEKNAIANRPTDNPAAYDAYLRGLAYTLKGANTLENLRGAQKLFGEAVRLDPGFALAWARLSLVRARGYTALSMDQTAETRETTKQAADTALRLQPNLGEALLAQGYYYYACLKDFDTAARFCEQARALLPNNSQIPELLGYLSRRRGRWDQATQYLSDAIRLDPANANLLAQQALTYVSLRRFPDAIRTYDQVLKLTPGDADVQTGKASVAQAEGDLPRAGTLLASLHPTANDAATVETMVYQALLERRPAPAIERLQALVANPDPELSAVCTDYRFYLGWAQHVAGDERAARAAWQQARAELRKQLEEQPDSWALVGELALTEAALANKAEALSLAERALALLPISKDAMDGPGQLEILARVAAQVGEPDRAIAALERVLALPYESLLAMNLPLTPALLRADPMFDALRGDSRFQKLLEAPGPPARQ